MGRACLCPAGLCVILPGLCMTPGVASLPRGIQKKSGWPGMQVPWEAPRLSREAGAVRAGMGGRGRQASGLSSSGLPVTSYDDVFLLDPLLPCGQRVPLYLSKPPQQVRRVRPFHSPPLPPRGLGGQLSLPVSSGSGRSEAAAPTSHRVLLGASLAIPGLLLRLAQRSRDDRPHWPAADEPERAALSGPGRPSDLCQLPRPCR